MPDEAYSSVSRGALKLKGSSSSTSGIKKKKKKPKPSAEPSEPKTSALQRALEDEDASAELTLGEKGKSKDVSDRTGDGDENEEGQEEDSARMRELDPRGQDGKTASERAREEMRRKRVCVIVLF